MKIGYLRVSTEDQSHQRQMDSLSQICDELHVETLSASSKKRPVFEAVLAKLQSGDTLVIHDLDRAFRSTIDALMQAQKLRERGVHFQIVNLNVDTATPAGQLTYTVLAAYAEFERQTLIQRTREGMQAAKKRGVRLGRPKKLSADELSEARLVMEAGNTTLGALARRLGCSRDTLSKALNAWR
jgi:DNA invertase Pin-like site-specific DNA recombinase